MLILKSSAHFGNNYTPDHHHFIKIHSRSNCDCGSYVKDTGRFAEVLIYTRNGSFTAKHLEFRYDYMQDTTIA